jgi:hypothetical protein
MIVGQEPTTYVGDNIRMISQIVPVSNNFTLISLPSTKIEANAALNGRQSVSSISMSSSQSNQDLPEFKPLSMNLISRPAKSMTPISMKAIKDNTTTDNDKPNSIYSYSSNTLLLQINEEDFCDNIDEYDVLFTLTNNIEETYGDQTSDNITYITQCLNESPKVYTYNCPFGKNLTVECDGSKTTGVISQCPVRTHTPTCAILLHSQLIDSSVCKLVSYSSLEIQCSCNVCAVDSDGNIIFHKSSSKSNNKGFMIEIAAVVDSTVTEFVNIMKTAENFSFESLEKTALMMTAFASLWIFIFGFICFQENITSYKNANNKKKIENKIIPIVKNKPTERQVHKSMKSYVEYFFSTVYSEEPFQARLINEVLSKHRYFSLLNTTGGDKYMGGLQIFTDLTFNMFLLAFFYDLQFPTNDGVCTTHNDLNSCLNSKLVFDNSQSTCTWSQYEQTTGSTSFISYRCEYLEPQFSMFMLVVISVMVLIISEPFSILFAYLFDNILLAPTFLEVRDEEKVLEKRKKIASEIVKLQQYQSDQEKDKNEKVIAKSKNKDNNEIDNKISIQSSNDKIIIQSSDVINETFTPTYKDKHIKENHVFPSKTMSDLNNKDKVKYTGLVAWRSKLNNDISKQRGQITEFAHSSLALKRKSKNNFGIMINKVNKMSNKILNDNISNNNKMKPLNTQAVDIDQNIEDNMEVKTIEKNIKEQSDIRKNANKNFKNAVKKKLEENKNNNKNDTNNSKNIFRDIVEKAKNTRTYDFNEFITNQKTSIRRQSTMMVKRQTLLVKAGNNTDTAIINFNDKMSFEDDTVLPQENDRFQDILKKDIEDLVQKTIYWEEYLKNQSQSIVGVYILYFFIMDLLGREKNEAKIFSNLCDHLFQKSLVVSSTLKSFALILVVLLNLYFIFACLLYGVSKGISWQKGWLVAFILNIVIDIFINEIFVVSIVHFVIPNFIFNSASNAKITLTQTISSLFFVIDKDDEDLKFKKIKISYSDYFFLSVRLARLMVSLNLI